MVLCFLKRIQPRKEGTLYDSINQELKLLQVITKKAVIWLIQEFNDWNKKEGARVRQMVEEQNDLGWQKEKTLPGTEVSLEHEC